MSAVITQTDVVTFVLFVVGVAVFFLVWEWADWRERRRGR